MAAKLALAYATTIHKSQGPEYPAVVIPLSTQHYPMLQRKPGLHRSDPWAAPRQRKELAIGVEGGADRETAVEAAGGVKMSSIHLTRFGCTKLGANAV